MPPIPFRPLTLADREVVQRCVRPTHCRNCDLNFMNLMSWRFIYQAEMALWGEWLLFRFQTEGRYAYLMPVGNGDFAAPLAALLADAAYHGRPFLMLGVCEHSLALVEAALPGQFSADADRDFADYVYLRERLATLAGKKLQPKRNHASRFRRLYPHYEYRPLEPSLFAACEQLERKWAEGHAAEGTPYSNDAQRRSMAYVFDHWAQLGGEGGALVIDGQVAAFTYGAPINEDTFGVCFEKADADFDGAYAAINQEFACSLPERFVYLNREEDLGLPGLRKAKLSYQPETILLKYAVVERTAAPQS